jgi:hypothetical protein
MQETSREIVQKYLFRLHKRQQELARSVAKEQRLMRAKQRYAFERFVNMLEFYCRLHIDEKEF